MQTFDPWNEMPRRSIIVLLLSIFSFFTTIGFANDIISLGYQQTVRFVLGVILSGLFAVFYAVGGIQLRKKWWKAVIPICAVHFLVMGYTANRFPDRPTPPTIDATELHRLHNRFIFDSVAIIAAVSLGYGGFFHVSVNEARRHVKMRTENVLYENEMAAAREIQQVILPDSHQSFPGFAVDSVYKPAREVGGDFFQILPLPDRSLLVVLGDVAGKGLPAAMLVSLLIGSIRALAEDTREPAVLLRKLNEQIIGHTASGFATALVALFSDDGLVTIANAGHLSPYLDSQEIALPGGLPLGITGGVQYEATKISLGLRNWLTFLSDGVVEAQNSNGELLGFDRAKAISSQPATDIVDAAVEFGQSDDITVVKIARRATP